MATEPATVLLAPLSTLHGDGAVAIAPLAALTRAFLITLLSMAISWLFIPTSLY